VKEDIVPKEKAQVPPKKLKWVPVQENPSSIGSSKAFAAPAEPLNTLFK